MIDLVIRGGRIVDGTGAPPTTGDLAIDDGRIVLVGGRFGGEARRVLEADGALITPGFVDVHTHYDAQVHWDPLVTPSSEHGVTTVVIGNCGLGLAPVRPEGRAALQSLLAGVEDIPEACLEAGVQGSWESHGEYLDLLAETPRAVDVAALVGHAALRIHALGPERAFREPAREDEIETMRVALRKALASGALGLATSRSRADRDAAGRPTPTCFASDQEVHSLAAVVAETGHGLLQLAFRGSAGDEIEAFADEMDWMRRLAETTELPVTFGVAQMDASPDLWRLAFETAEHVRGPGASLRPQVLGRMQSVLVGLETVHPFAYRPSYRALAELPLAERTRRLADPDTRRRILSETPGTAPANDPFSGLFDYAPDRIFPLEEPLDYEPDSASSLAARAAATGQPPMELLYDLLLEDEGRQLQLYAVASYHAGDDRDIHAMIDHPQALFGLADGGAHSGLLCDAGIQTYLLTHWSRDRKRGPRFPLERIVEKLTSEPAGVFGLNDRGRLAPGLRADVNVIDPEALAAHRPRVVYDFPTGARRIVQGAAGYLATIVRGSVTREHGLDTGSRPGGVARRTDHV